MSSTAVAQEYRGPWSIATNEWILYAGGRSLSFGAIGGTGSGSNFPSVFSDENSVLNRGFSVSGSVLNLPVWEGAISFDNDGGVNWHFDHTTVAPTGTTDLYSITLHEVGHALGLATSWQEWMASGGAYTGPRAIAAYNDDNWASESFLSEVSSSNHHWKNQTYDSKIFALSEPNLIGTVGSGNLQDVLMGPAANFTATVRRFELTNVDVDALQDIGWTVVPEPGSLGMVAMPLLTLCFRHRQEIGGSESSGTKHVDH